jgi:hypothetical protein
MGGRRLPRDFYRPLSLHEYRGAYVPIEPDFCKRSEADPSDTCDVIPPEDEIPHRCRQAWKVTHPTTDSMFGGCSPSHAGVESQRMSEF